MKQVNKFINIRGKFNEILSDSIGDNTIISGWTFISKNVIIGKNVKLGNFVNIDSDCLIGDNCNIQSFCYLSSKTKVGKNSMFSTHVKFADERFMTLDTKNIRRKPCEVGENVRIGMGSVLVSCKIGDNAVIGANSLVLQDVPKNEVWFGSPAESTLMTRKYYDEKMLREYKLEYHFYGDKK